MHYEDFIQNPEQQLKKVINFLVYHNLPLLNNVEQSNTMHTKFILEKILEFNIQNVGIYGLAFKKGTDDLRFSKSLDICEQLLGKGKNIYVYDRYVNISKIIGSKTIKDITEDSTIQWDDIEVNQ